MLLLDSPKHSAAGVRGVRRALRRTDSAASRRRRLAATAGGGRPSEVVVVREAPANAGGVDPYLVKLQVGTRQVIF